MSTQNTEVHTSAPNRARVAFLLPTYKTPSMTAELLYAANGAGLYADCPFVLLLDRSDPAIGAYTACVENLREGGMSVGYITSDGVPYAGMINRVAHLIEADSLCVIDNKHLPVTEGPVVEVVSEWLSSMYVPMGLAVFGEAPCYPVVTQKLIERLGYMFHPLCEGRAEAERWLISVATKAGVACRLSGRVMESKVDGVEILGYSSNDSFKWTVDVLSHVVDDVAAHIRHHVVQ